MIFPEGPLSFPIISCCRCFPLLIFVSALLGRMFAGNSELYRDFLTYLGSVMPESAFNVVRSLADGVGGQDDGHGSGE